jgi:hypothetical protein
LRLGYPTARREGPPTELDRLFDVCENFNLWIGAFTTALPGAELGYKEQLLGPACTLVLGLEALVDGGHTFAAETLHRPILERIGAFYYAMDAGVSGELDWLKHGVAGKREGAERKRPSYPALLKYIPLFSKRDTDGGDFRVFLANKQNREIHADPASHLHLYIRQDESRSYFVSGPRFHDQVAMDRCRTLTSLVVLAFLEACTTAYPHLFAELNPTLTGPSQQRDGEPTR